MASQSFAFTDSAVAKLGAFAAQTWVSRAAYFHTPTVTGNRLDFEVLGDTATLPYNAHTGSVLSVTVDGSTSTPALTTDLTWQNLTLFSGLDPDTYHRVTIRWDSSANQNYPKVEATNFVTVDRSTGTPAIRYPTEATWGPIYDFRNGTYSSAFRVDDSTGTTAFGSQPVAQVRRGGVITFETTGTLAGVALFGFGTAHTIRVAFNRSQAATSTAVATASSKFQLVTATSGHALSGTNEVRIVFGDQNPVSYWGVMVFGGATVNTSKTWSARRKLVAYGDSKTQGDYPSGAAQRIENGWLNLLGLWLDVAVANRGNAAQNVHTYGRDNTSQVTALSYSAGDRILIPGFGRNDAGNAVSQADFEASFDTMLDNILAGVATVPVDVYGITEEASGGLANATRNTYDGYISGVVTALANSRVTFTSTDGVITPATAYTAGDNVHYDDDGDIEYANWIAPRYADVGYTVSLGAASGAAGEAVTITFTRAAGTTWRTGETISGDDNGGGGSFGPFTFTAGQTTATMTYTPASAGVKTLSFTNGQEWTDAADEEYEATAAGPNLAVIVQHYARLRTN